MMDMINAAFEFGGFLAIIPSIMAVLRDKRVHGISILTPLFFTSWGFWNIFYYPSLDQIWSAWAAVLLSLTNGIYLVLLFHYRARARKEPFCKESGGCMSATQPKRTAATMGYSMDGMRKNLARAHNRLFSTLDESNSEQREAANEVAQYIGFLISVFDNTVENDFNMIDDEVTVDYFSNEVDEHE